MKKSFFSHLPDPPVLELDRLVVNEDPLALIRLGFPPFPNACREIIHNLLIGRLQQDTGRLRGASRDALGNSQLDGMRISQLQRDELLTGVFGGDGRRSWFDTSSVTDTD